MNQPKMAYRRFGRTELQMPVFSCGGMRFQHAWKDCPPEEIPAEGQQNLEATIQRAWELGINHFETARGYGTSEMQLGRILQQLPRDQIIVQTKIPPKPSVDEFRRIFETSMEYLKLDYVDLLALHGVNNEEIYDHAFRAGCYEALLEYKEQGLCRFVGFSTHANRDVILRTIESGDFDYINLHWYYIFQHNWPAIQAARQRDMGVFIISPSDKGGMLYKPSEIFRTLCDPLHPMVFNDLFCLSRPEIHTLSLGAARPGDFDEHLKVLPLLDRAGEIVAPIVERLNKRMQEKLGRDWLQTWDQGLPGPCHTIQDLNVFALLLIRNLIIAFDMVEYGKSRYSWFGEGGHWFPGKPIESAEHLRSLNLDRYLNNSPHADKVADYLAQVYEWVKPESTASAGKDGS